MPASLDASRGASGFAFAAVEQTEPRVAAAGGKELLVEAGQEGGGGVKVGVTWQSSSKIAQTPRQGSA